MLLLALVIGALAGDTYESYTLGDTTITLTHPPMFVGIRDKFTFELTDNNTCGKLTAHSLKSTQGSIVETTKDKNVFAVVMNHVEDVFLLYLDDTQSVRISVNASQPFMDYHEGHLSGNEGELNTMIGGDLHSAWLTEGTITVRKTAVSDNEETYKSGTLEEVAGENLELKLFEGFREDYLFVVQSETGCKLYIYDNAMKEAISEVLCDDTVHDCGKSFDLAEDKFIIGSPCNITENCIGIVSAFTFSESGYKSYELPEYSKASWAWGSDVAVDRNYLVGNQVGLLLYIEEKNTWDTIVAANYNFMALFGNIVLFTTGSSEYNLIGFSLKDGHSIYNIEFPNTIHIVSSGNYLMLYEPEEEHTDIYVYGFSSNKMVKYLSLRQDGVYPYSDNTYISMDGVSLVIPGADENKLVILNSSEESEITSLYWSTMFADSYETALHGRFSLPESPSPYTITMSDDVLFTSYSPTEYDNDKQVYTGKLLSDAKPRTFFANIEEFKYAGLTRRNTIIPMTQILFSTMVIYPRFVDELTKVTIMLTFVDELGNPQILSGPQQEDYTIVFRVNTLVKTGTETSDTETVCTLNDNSTKYMCSQVKIPLDWDGDFDVCVKGKEEKDFVFGGVLVVNKYPKFNEAVSIMSRLGYEDGEYKLQMDILNDNGSRVFQTSQHNTACLGNKCADADFDEKSLSYFAAFDAIPSNWDGNVRLSVTYLKLPSLEETTLELTDMISVYHNDWVIGVYITPIVLAGLVVFTVVWFVTHRKKVPKDQEDV